MTARSLVEAVFPNRGSAALVVPWMDLDHEPWHERLRRFAELVGPDAEWTVRPIPEDETDRHALLGY